MFFTASSVLRKSAALSVIVALTMVLSACDRCGDLLKGEGGSMPLSCKSDGPKPQ